MSSKLLLRPSAKMSSKPLCPIASKAVVALIAERRREKRATKMAYKAAARTASKMATKNQARKMESMTVAIASAWFPGYTSKTCDHCGTKGSSTELFCDCEAMITRFGAVGCKCCGIYYGTMDSIEEYVVAWGGQEAFDQYGELLRYWMPTPCLACSSVYTEEYMIKHADFANWKDKNWSHFDDWDPYEYDEPCRSGRGAPCPCCGD